MDQWTNEWGDPSLQVYKQKVKHLLYEHQNNITTLKADAEMALKLQQDEFRKRSAELNKDKRSLKLELKELELAHEDVVRQLKLEHAKEITKLRQEFELNAKEMLQKYEKKMKVLREDFEHRRKHEIHEIEERKNTHINQLMKKHDTAFSEIKNYYNDITHNNLDLIKTLKDDVAEMKKKEATNDQLMYEISQENKRLSEPLTKALREVDELRKALASYDKDKQSLAHTKTRLLDSEKTLKNLEWEHEVQMQRFVKVEKERDELYAKFERAIFEVQQKSGLKNLVLERKLEAGGSCLPVSSILSPHTHIWSSVHSFTPHIWSSVHSFTHHIFGHPSIHSHHTFGHPSIHPHTHLVIHPFIHPPHNRCLTV